MTNSTLQTLIFEDREPVEAARVEGQGIWVPVGEFHDATAWELRPEGFCRHNTCLPVPSGRENEFVSSTGERVDIAAFARLREQPVVCDVEARVCVFGFPAGGGGPPVGSIAPDFALPDLEGVEHRLSDHRGRKVLLLSWASW